MVHTPRGYAVLQREDGKWHGYRTHGDDGRELHYYEGVSIVGRKTRREAAEDCCEAKNLARAAIAKAEGV